ncbi:MASE1 domain-containing protein [Dyella sp. C9]|uniref:MASE1 domain-containing protein n=1 Tax=Dyella sp. C9 TaxID=2202154 RepID=UPI001300B62E
MAAAYCSALFLLRQVTLPHWIVITGFHLSLLLLLNYAYWPALLIGGLVRMAFVSIECYPQFGLAWALVNLIPAIAYYAPVAWLFRERGQLFPKPRSLNLMALVVCLVLVSSMATLVTLLQLHLTPLPPDYDVQYDDVVPRLILGNYLGVLTVVPSALVIAWTIAEGRGRWSDWSHDVMDSRLLFECIFLVVPALCFFGLVGVRDPNLRPVAQMGMFLPVAFLALRQGWKGAALSGTLASISIMMLMPERNDPATMEAETLLALAITTMLLVGAHVTVLNRRAEQERLDLRMALALAQRNVYLGEVQLRSAALAVENVRESVGGIVGQVLARLRHAQPTTDDHGVRRLAQSAQDQLDLLTDSLHPPLLRDRGLPGALIQGGLARMLSDAGVRYWCDIRGPISHFSHAMHLAVYRIVCDAISEACTDRNVNRVLVKIRCGTRGRPRIAVFVQTRSDSQQPMDIQWGQLLPRLRLCSSGMGWRAIEDRTATFEGHMRRRSLEDGARLVVSLLGAHHPRA